MNVHPTAARGFDSTAELYERARPGYPAEAAQFLLEAMAVAEPSLVVDLGAGTGKFTRELVARKIRCIAVEPVEGMRTTFSQQLPGVEIRDGSAEAMPFPDATADGVVCAQAFHWFATKGAVAEIARVLKPGASLGLIWNARDDAVDWVAEVTKIFKRYEGADGVRVPRHRERKWRAPIDASPLFEEGPSREFPNSQTLTPEGLLDRISSVSFIAVLPPEERAGALADLKHLIATHRDLEGKDAIEHPYVTEVYVFSRR